ncbi:MAG: toxin-antitoxin system YwqK family antitoxin, partial [Mycetocola sp.]
AGADHARVRGEDEHCAEAETIEYHATGHTVFSRGRYDGTQPTGYWEWYRIDGTLKRSGHFVDGEPVGEWITYDGTGAVYKITHRGAPA